MSHYGLFKNSRGTLDLWVRGGPDQSEKQLTHFFQDTFAPSVSNNGRVLFKTQNYRTFVVVVPAEGGATRQVTTFQSETPGWDWSSKQISFTYGTWRRAIDDFHYPDIAQQIGVVRFNPGSLADKPDTIVRHSYSEDQGMSWSPNGKWIVFHTHADGTDDIWLKPADGSTPGVPLSIGGNETGWPRWSPDGRWIVVPSEIEEDHVTRSIMFLIGIDQETGKITVPRQQIQLDGFKPEATALAEWSPDSKQLVFESMIEPGKHGIFVVARDGGMPRKIHEFASDQFFSGASVSPDFEWVAFTAPANDGYFQLFRVTMEGGKVEQLTFDPSNKVQPALFARRQVDCIYGVQFSSPFLGTGRLSAFAPAAPYHRYL